MIHHLKLLYCCININHELRYNLICFFKRDINKIKCVLKLLMQVFLMVIAGIVCTFQNGIFYKVS